MTEPTAPAPEERPEITRSPVQATVIGLLAGAASSLLGIGGGLLMVPAMVHTLRIRQHRAVGTSLAVILPTALAAAVRYHHEAIEHNEPGLELRVILWLAIGGVVGAVLGARIANALGARQLRRAFGVFVILTGMLMIARLTPAPQHAETMDAGRMVVMTLVGVLVGAVSGLLGVGGGLIMVPALVLLMGYPQHQAQGTSLAVIIPVSISGSLVHFLRGNVIWSLAIWQAAGAVLGAWLVAGTVFGIPQETLRLLFGAFLIFMGVTMVQSRKPPAAPPAGTPPTEGR